MSQYYFPYRGGQEAYVLWLSHHLSRLGHDIRVITTTSGDGASTARGHVETLRHPARITILNNPISFAVFRERKLLESCDLVHAHNEHSFLTLSAAALKGDLQKPLILTLHGQLRFGNPLLDRIESFYSRSVGDWILNRADHLFVNSPDDKSMVLRRGIPESKLTLVSNAVDADYLMSFASPTPRLRAGLPDDLKVILFIGRLTKRKGLGTLLEAFHRCARSRPDLVLLIVGKGPLRSYCERIRTEMNGGQRVRMFSSVTDESLYLLYQSADVFVLPSIAEVCPTVILEALFFDCPVIASDIPGIRDHFRGVLRLVPPGDAEALAVAILELIDNPSSGKSTQEFVRERYVWSLVSRTYASVFEKLVP